MSVCSSFVRFCPCRYQWQWVVLLPFIDEERLLKNCKTLEKSLTEEERERNRRGCDRLFVHRQHPLASILKAVVEDPQCGRGVYSHEDFDDLSLKNEEAYSGVRGQGKLLAQQQPSSSSRDNRFESAVSSSTAEPRLDADTKHADLCRTAQKEKEEERISKERLAVRKTGGSMTGFLFRNQYSVQVGEYVVSPIGKKKKRKKNPRSPALPPSRGASSFSL